MLAGKTIAGTYLQLTALRSVAVPRGMNAPLAPNHRPRRPRRRQASQQLLCNQEVPFRDSKLWKFSWDMVDLGCTDLGGW
jgi:hypothetical protein